MSEKSCGVPLHFLTIWQWHYTDVLVVVMWLCVIESDFYHCKP